MKNYKSVLAVLVIFIALACSPKSKEDYIERFSDFVEETEIKAKKGTIEDWGALDKKYEQYNETFYREFESDLGFKDQIKIGANRIRYQVIRNKTELLEDILNDKDVKEIRTKLKDYIENDLDKDVDEIVREAEKVGDEFGKAVKEIVDDIERELNKKQQ